MFVSGDAAVDQQKDEEIADGQVFKNTKISIQTIQKCLKWDIIELGFVVYRYNDVCCCALSYVSCALACTTPVMDVCT